VYVRDCLSGKTRVRSPRETDGTRVGGSRRQPVSPSWPDRRHESAERASSPGAEQQWFTAAEKHQGRQTGHANRAVVTGRVGVDSDNTNTVGVLLRELFEHGCKPFARATPGGGELDDNGSSSATNAASKLSSSTSMTNRWYQTLASLRCTPYFVPEGMGLPELKHVQARCTSSAGSHRRRRAGRPKAGLVDADHGKLDRR